MVAPTVESPGTSLFRSRLLDALEGLTVLDLTSHIAGPYAAKLLADLGARVIKVERPGGDPARRLGPFLHDEPGANRGATHQFLNTNKESIVLDLRRAEGREAMYRLAAVADLVVQNFSPRQEEELGTSYEAIRAIADISVLSMTNFGRSGPYRDFRLSDTVLFAMGGEMFSHGTLDREPLKLGGAAALLQCGAMGAVAAMGAVHATRMASASTSISRCSTPRSTTSTGEARRSLRFDSAGASKSGRRARARASPAASIRPPTATWR